MTVHPTRPNQSSGPSGDDWGQARYNHGNGEADYARPTPYRGVARADVPAQDREPDWHWDEGETTSRPGELQAKSGAGYAIAFLLLLAVAVLCVTGFLVARVFLSDSPPTLPPLAGLTPSPWVTGPGVQPTQIPGTPGQVRMAINPVQGYINTLITVTGEDWWPGEPVFVFLRSREEGSSPGYAYAAAVADDRGNFRTAFTFPNEMRWIGEEWADVIARGTRSGLEASIRFTLVAPTPTNTSPPPTARPTSLATDTPPASDTPLPTDTSLPTATPTPEVVITDWRGEYYDNPALSGEPRLVRNDVTVDFNWGTGSPDPSIPADRFSARWTRQVRFQEGQYRFTVSSDDGVRLWVDRQLVMDEWHDGALTDYTVNLFMSRGKHNLQVEYYENLGGAMVQLGWKRVEPPTATPFPSDTPTPSPTPSSTPSPVPGPTDTPTPTSLPSLPLPERWQGKYYANPILHGDPAFEREAAEINFAWGAGSPGEGIPADGFSVRWTGEVWTSGGAFAYYLTADEGARVWMDGRLIIDAWLAKPGQVHRFQGHLSEGGHIFQVEYFESLGQAHVRFWAEAVGDRVPSLP